MNGKLKLLLLLLLFSCSFENQMLKLYSKQCENLLSTCFLISHSDSLFDIRPICFSAWMLRSCMGTSHHWWALATHAASMVIVITATSNWCQEELRCHLFPCWKWDLMDHWRYFALCTLLQSFRIPGKLRGEREESNRVYTRMHLELLMLNIFCDKERRHNFFLLPILCVIVCLRHSLDLEFWNLRHPSAWSPSLLDCRT